MGYTWLDAEIPTSLESCHMAHSTSHSAQKSCMQRYPSGKENAAFDPRNFQLSEVTEEQRRGASHQFAFLKGDEALWLSEQPGELHL